jgi:hypothetical protein
MKQIPRRKRGCYPPLLSQAPSLRTKTSQPPTIVQIDRSTSRPVPIFPEAANEDSSLAPSPLSIVNSRATKGSTVPLWAACDLATRSQFGRQTFQVQTALLLNARDNCSVWQAVYVPKLNGCLLDRIDGVDSRGKGGSCSPLNPESSTALLDIIFPAPPLLCFLSSNVDLAAALSTVGRVGAPRSRSRPTRCPPVYRHDK